MFVCSSQSPFVSPDLLIVKCTSRQNSRFPFSRFSFSENSASLHPVGSCLSVPIRPSLSVCLSLSVAIFILLSVCSFLSPPICPSLSVCRSSAVCCCLSVAPKRFQFLSVCLTKDVSFPHRHLGPKCLVRSSIRLSLKNNGAYHVIKDLFHENLLAEIDKTKCSQEYSQLQILLHSELPQPRLLLIL